MKVVLTLALGNFNLCEVVIITRAVKTIMKLVIVTCSYGVVIIIILSLVVMT